MSTSKKTLEEISLHQTVGRQYKVRYRFPFAASFQQERNEIILDLLEGGEGIRVLDLGCGTGVMIDALAERFPSILGLDASMEMMTAIDRLPAYQWGFIACGVVMIPAVLISWFIHDEDVAATRGLTPAATASSPAPAS